MKIREKLAELFFPEADRCPVCGREGGFCEACRAALAELRADAGSAFYYDGIVRDMVHRLKFADQPYLARTMGMLMANLADVQGDLLTCVPLHAGRKRQRGYNQSEEIAREISRRTSIPYGHTLRRLRNTPPQSLMKDRTARSENIKNAFAVLPRAKIHGRKILLVDDVITTGATVEECRKVLLNAGAAEVNVISFARRKDHGYSKDTAQASVGER